MKQITAIIERSSEGMYSIYMSNADALSYSIIGTGFSQREALEDFHEGYKAMKEHYKETGKAFEEVSFTFQHDAVSYLQYYAKCFTLVALERITKISKSQLSHYINRTSNPKKQTADKIMAAIQKFFEQESNALHV